MPEAVVDSSAVPFPLQVGASPHFFVELQLECDRCATGVQASKTPALILHSSVSLRLCGEIRFLLLPDPCPLLLSPTLPLHLALGRRRQKTRERIGGGGARFAGQREPFLPCGDNQKVTQTSCRKRRKILQQSQDISDGVLFLAFIFTGDLQSPSSEEKLVIRSIQVRILVLKSAE